jgi:hypothetical protein
MSAYDPCHSPPLLIFKLTCGIDVIAAIAAAANIPFLQAELRIFSCELKKFLRKDMHFSVQREYEFEATA